MTTLTWLPKSDSRRSHNYAQTDGSGSGVDVAGMEMPVESRSRGASPSDDEEEYGDYYDNYYGDTGSGGYGSGDQFLDETPTEKGTPVHETKTASSGRPEASLMVMVMVMVAVSGAVLHCQG